MTSRPSPPPDCGKRLLPVVIDEYARDQPERPWASIPIDDWDLTQGYEDVSYGALANAINKLAWYIERTIGRSSNLETIAYLGVPDIRYHMMEIAACKTGHKVLFSSQLNSLHVHCLLMRQTECTALFSAVGVRVDDIMAELPDMVHARVPDLDDLIDVGDRAPPYPYTKTFEEVKFDPYLILHSSGTTGEPKPIMVNHAMTASVDALQMLPDAYGRSQCYELSAVGDGVRFISVTLPYHIMSAQYALNLSVFGGGVFVPGFRHRGVDTTDIYSIIENARVTKAILTPWMMEDIARKPNAKDYIERFSKVCFGGATLSSYATEVWARYTRIQNIWGATDAWAPPQLDADNEDAAYVCFDTEHGALEFRRFEAEYFADDGSLVDLYEIVFTMRPENAHLSGWHLSQGLTPENAGPRDSWPEYRLGDLWTQHPDPAKAPYAWRFAGRTDDIITFSTGINMHPAPMERAINASPSVSASVIVGANRRQPVLLVELAEGLQPRKGGHELENGNENGDENGNNGETVPERQLWEDVIKPQNTRIPAHARVAHSHILYFPAKTFVRTPKGSVSRKQTERGLADEIEEVYRKHGDRWQEGNERFGSIVHTLDLKVEFSDHTANGAERDSA